MPAEFREVGSGVYDWQGGGAGRLIRFLDPAMTLQIGNVTGPNGAPVTNLGIGQITIPAAKANAWTVQDAAGNAFWQTDTRLNVSGIKSHLLSAPNPTIGSAAGATYSMVANGAQTVNFTGNTQVTALNGVGFFIGQTTIAGDTATLTVVTASTLWINGAPLAGANVAVTNPNALQVNSGFSVFGGNVSVGGAAIADNGIYIRGTPFGTANYNRGIYNTPTFPSTGTTGAVLYEGFHTLTNGATYAGVLGYGCGAVSQGTAVITKFAGHGVDQQSPITITNNFRCFDCNSQTVATTGGGGNVDMFYILSLITTGSNNRTTGLFIGSVSAVGATNAYGILIGNVTGAGTGNFAIQTGTGALSFGGKITTYNAIATAGNGVGAIVASGRPAAQTNTTTTITSYANPATDASYEIRCNVNVTVSTTVTMTVTCTYTDESNTARTLTIPFFVLAGTMVQSITTAQGNIAYESVPITIRVKASTTITLATAGTVTSVVYTCEGHITQIA